MNGPATARVLAFAADAMVIEPALDLDSAVRLAVWDDPDAPFPQAGADGAEVFADAMAVLHDAFRSRAAGVSREGDIEVVRAEAMRLVSVPR
ncbi:hypothetical protein [Streptomyces sp. NBC_00670]|uniref:hypothetical protein n=1 Tax=Streptomyces sp. NBC_00670 TaxID=2975804 RepID=UPI002E32C5BC|nr:hypothetical protein [Streptomyces sp. NBC_00670]